MERPTPPITASSRDAFRGEDFFKQAFLHAATGLAIVNLDGHFSYVNPAFSKITGYTAAELKKLTIGALMSPEDVASNGVLRKKMLSGEIPGYVIEKHYIRKDGTRIWVKSSVSLIYNAAGEPIHLVGLTEDIDERHLAETALKESEARFRFMAEYVPAMVYTITPEGAIDYFSPQWATYTGISERILRQGNWPQIVHPDDLQANTVAWEYALATGEPFYFEHRLRRADGSYRWHIARTHPQHDSAGLIIKWIGSDTDVEELRQSRDLKSRLEVLAEQREQLIATNKSKDEFIMLASHQLRTPSTGVKQYIGMLLEGFADPLTEQQRAILTAAYESNERQLKIVDDLLRVARVDAGQILLDKQACDLVATIRSAIAEQNSIFAARKQAIAFRSGKKPATAFIDAELMYIVFENLLDNASKYSFEGTTTIVELRENRNAIYIRVKDNGVGIAKEDQKRLFQKFSRIVNPLSDTVSGTGLGLYWAKKIVELHGGSLRVTSRPGIGSTFSVRLPLSETHSPEKEET